jgi:agmatine deiminase
MLTWPHIHGDWAMRLKQVEPVFVEIAKQVCLREKVLIACYDRSHGKQVGKQLAEAGVDMNQVILRAVPSNDTWARDHGPLTVMCAQEALLLDFGFNGWGGKYGFDLDNQITRRLYAMDVFQDTPMQTIEMILEGGAIEVDGSGTLLTTARCLLATTRNPGMTREQLDERLKDLLGLNRVLWLHHGYLAGDDTDSHIDTLARFCDSRTIAYVRCDDSSDEHYVELKSMEDELKTFRAADGQPYRLVPLPWPRTKLDEDGNRLPATYANFLVINGAVLVPTYEDPADSEALRRLAECFPDREVVAINSLPLIYQFGSLHCVTMQLPEGVL